MVNIRPVRGRAVMWTHLGKLYYTPDLTPQYPPVLELRATNIVTVDIILIVISIWNLKKISSGKRYLK
jgi:hypothetical protein